MNIQPGSDIYFIWGRPAGKMCRCDLKPKNSVRFGTALFLSFGNLLTLGKIRQSGCEMKMASVESEVLQTWRDAGHG